MGQNTTKLLGKNSHQPYASWRPQFPQEQGISLGSNTEGSKPESDGRQGESVPTPPEPRRANNNPSCSIILATSLRQESVLNSTGLVPTETARSHPLRAARSTIEPSFPRGSIFPPSPPSSNTSPCDEPGPSSGWPVGNTRIPPRPTARTFATFRPPAGPPSPIEPLASGRQSRPVPSHRSSLSSVPNSYVAYAEAQAQPTAPPYTRSRSRTSGDIEFPFLGDAPTVRYRGGRSPGQGLERLRAALEPLNLESQPTSPPSEPPPRYEDCWCEPGPRDRPQRLLRNVSNEQEDRDLALALQLQEEEAVKRNEELTRHLQDRFAMLSRARGMPGQWPRSRNSSSYSSRVPSGRTRDKEAGRLKHEQEEADRALALRLEEEERRRAEAPKTKTCDVCQDEKPLSEFPDQITRKCKHPVKICQDDLKNWIASQLDAQGWDRISCPENGCTARLQYADVSRNAASAIFDRYDSLATREELNKIPNFRWCIGPNCRSGQIHDSGTDGPIFTCAACGFKICVIHERKWHDGETCAQYNYRKSGKKRRDEEAASKAVVAKTTKKCPGKKCRWNIEKNDGCDHMTCSKCRHEFCWICLAPYEPIRKRGNAAHRAHCKYHTSNVQS